jgi:hypothetical protein
MTERAEEIGIDAAATKAALAHGILVHMSERRHGWMAVFVGIQYDRCIAGYSLFTSDGIRWPRVHSATLTMPLFNSKRARVFDRSRMEDSLAIRAMFESELQITATSMFDPPPDNPKPLINAAARFVGGCPPDLLQLMAQVQSIAHPERGTVHIVHGPWSRHEDSLLMAAVARTGTEKWTEIAKSVQTRNSKQCRERWHDHLAPGIRREPFSTWEDGIIAASRQELGNHWSKIAKRLLGRSAGAVKNRWYSALKAHTEVHEQINFELDNEWDLL